MSNVATANGVECGRWLPPTSRSNVLFCVTICYMLATAASSVRYGLSARSATADLLFLVAGALGILLLLGNVVFAVQHRLFRFRHVALAAGLIALWPFSWWTDGWRVGRRRAAFALGGKAAYERAVTDVLNSKALLTGTEASVESIVSDHPHASALTNQDSSVTIFFPGLEGSYRHGYVYHSSGQLPARIGDLELVHLTNGWYEY